MIFLKDSDFKGVLAASVIASLRGNNDDDLNEAEKLAISELDPLQSKFKIDAELSKTNAARNSVLLRILVHLTSYYLYNSIVDDEIPDRIVDNWKKELNTIEKIANGKIGSTLEPELSDEGKKVTGFRMGSNKKRTHQLYPSTNSGENAI